MRRSEQLAFQVVGPAVQGTDDLAGIAAAVEHDGLPVAADIGKELEPLFAPHEKAALLLGRERVVVPGFRDHEFMANVTRSLFEQDLDFALIQRWIEIRRNRKLGCRALQMIPTPEIRHDSTSVGVSSGAGESTLDRVAWVAAAIAYTVGVTTLARPGRWPATRATMSSPATGTNPGDPSAPAPSFEAALDELEALIQQMESGQLSLEASVAAYRRGATLVAYCRDNLSRVQQQVRVLEGDLLKPFDGQTPQGS